MGLFLRAYDEEEKEVTIEFVSIASVASTKSEILMNKVREILLNNNIDIANNRFSCPDGANTMFAERTGLQKRIRIAPFSIYINCRCHRLALYYALSIYLINFLGLNQLTGFCLRCGKAFAILKINPSYFEVYSRSLWFKSAESRDFAMGQHASVVKKDTILSLRP